MGMDSTVNINTAHIQSVQVVANHLEQEIVDGASAVSDTSSGIISSGTDTIKSVVHNVSNVVSNLNTYLDQVATAFYSADASLANSISEGGIITSYGNPNYVDPYASVTAPVTDAEREAANSLPD
ncbi:hypothetical protein [uncultured Streptococcus sp.]|uniref:hypothetical protein n=1 Tax=uncultured Streptococcus sp. TaxID=83427 RepID=UPI0025F170F2|nr:hypothetical protein [uncultured Streptococcus sp.]